MLATDSEIYAADYATNGAQTPEARDALARHAVALNRELRDGRMGRDRRGPKPAHDHPWVQQGRAMVEAGRARGRGAR